MTLGEAMLRFGFDVDKSTIATVENTINKVRSVAKKALGAIGIGFTISGLAGLAEEAANAEATVSQFGQVFGDLEKQAADSLSTIASDTGIVKNRLKGSYTQIAAFAKTSGMETSAALELTNRSLVAVADSAAFYDRTLESTAESLQSFLKGNYANDAALGLSCTETTRNTAANALYGKSFKNLAEDQKQLTLLKMVEDANKLSGALGQAARESDTWGNQLGNFKQSITDIKVAFGKLILKPAVVGLKLFSNILQGISKKVPDIAKGFSNLADEMFGVTNGENNLTRAFKSTNDIVKKLKPAIERMMQTISNGAIKAARFIRGIIDRVGGLENAFKLLAIVVSAFILVMNWSKIIGGAKAFISLISGIGKMFNIAKLKVLALVAIIVILALIIEDFINFLKGNDSVIGTIFDKAGIGADNAREAIFNAWNKIKEFLINVWDFIKQAASMFVDTVKGFFEKHMDSIRSNFERAWGIIKTFLSGVWTFISQLASTLFGGTEDSIEGSSMGTKDKLLLIWKNILDALSAIWDTLYEVGSAIFNAIAAVIEFVFNAIKIFWNAWGTQILAWFKVLWNSLGGILRGFLDIVQGIATFISSVFKGDWAGAWEAIKQIFMGIWNIIVNYISYIWETIKLLFSMALSVIAALWNALWQGISNFFQAIWNGIVSFIGGIWSVITSIISGAINGAYNIIVAILNAIKSIFTTIFGGVANFVSSTFKNILSGITNIVGNIKDAIVNGFKVAIDWIKGLPSEALTWGKDIISGIADGITGAIGKVTGAVKGVAKKITSFLHFSVPDEGPLTDYESWMPDFMGGLAKGIEDNEDTVISKVKKLASGVANFSNAAKAQAKTIANSTVSTSSSNITQNNTFNNSYSGGDMQTQANVSKGMNRSANDATSQLAKGLAYAR